MKFYQRWPGDYMRDTAHLSLLQHGAYNVLLDHYYSTGKPLQANDKQMLFICRANDKHEQEAVLSVLAEFFPVSEVDGLRHNSRADTEIIKAQAISLKRAEAGHKGGRPANEKQLLNNSLTNVKLSTTTTTTTTKSTNTDDTTLARSCKKHTTKPQRFQLTKDGHWLNLSSELRKIWSEAYPAVDIDKELALAKAWIFSDPLRWKKNWTRFMQGWLSRSQDKYTGKPGIQVAQQSQPAAQEMTADELEREVRRFDEALGRSVSR